MEISETLLQHYFLEIEPSSLGEVAGKLAEAEAEAVEDELLGGWRLFAWIDRPAIWAVRPVKRTVGLDGFLFSDCGLPGVVDVAEAMSFPMRGHEPGCGLKNDWEAFNEATSTSPGTLFLSFLQLNWDTLLLDEAWGEERLPRRSDVLDRIRSHSWQSLVRLFGDQRPPPLLMVATAGDADLMVYGWVQNPSELDRCLYAFTEMTIADLASGAGAQNYPVLLSSHSELAVDLIEYQSLRRKVKEGHSAVDQESHIAPMFDGYVSAEIGFARGHASLADLNDSLSNMITSEWSERAILGGEDLVLATQRSVTFAELLCLQARLDEKFAEDPGFVRRSSLRLGFEEAYGKSSPIPTATVQQSKAPGRRELLVPNHLAELRNELARLRDRRWREDLRIIERMVERCVTLQKSREMRRETRNLAANTLKRLLHLCEKVQLIESEYSKAEDADQRNALVTEIQLIRRHLVKAGMALDMALTHHSRGVTSLLLHRATQARGPEHFGSEVALSLGLTVMFRSVARRIVTGAEEDARSCRSDYAEDVLGSLSDLQEPTVYASHEPDFSIDPTLSMLHVPRWALWYPTASAHLMHEFGHALAEIGHLGYLLESTVAAFANRLIDCEDVFRPGLSTLVEAFGNAETLDLQDAASRLLQVSGSQVLGYANAIELEEIACDLLSRLYSHAPSKDLDHVWLSLCLDYTVPFAARNGFHGTFSRVERLLGGFVSFYLLRATQEACGDPLNVQAAVVADKYAREAVDVFVEGFSQWAEHQLVRSSTLPDWVKHEIQKVADNVEAWSDENSMPRYACRGALIVRSFLVPLEGLETNPSAYKSILTWRNAIRAGWMDLTPSEEDCGVIEALKERRIPEMHARYPERLPAALALSLRDSEGRVTPSHRVALAFYLYDLRISLERS